MLVWLHTQPRAGTKIKYPNTMHNKKIDEKIIKFNVNFIKKYLSIFNMLSSFKDAACFVTSKFL